MITTTTIALPLGSMRIGNNMEQLYGIYENLKATESQVYRLFKDSDETAGVHLTMLQQDIDSALTVLEDLLGIGDA